MVLSENQKYRDGITRRTASNEKIKKLGIICFEDLPCIETSKDVQLKSIDLICKKAIATLLVIQIACDIEAGDYEESMKIMGKMIDEFGVREYMNRKEMKILDGSYTEQDVTDVVWEYEVYWSLIWALGLVDEIEIPDSICDCERAIRFVGDCKDYQEFKSHIKPRDIETILDMLDLYYRYHWATTEHRIHPDAEIGALEGEVVVERRRGLEWLVSEEEDWYDISLDT